MEHKQGRGGRLELSTEHIAYLLYLVAADIFDSNLEPDTPHWYFRAPAAEVASGVAVRPPSRQVQVASTNV